MIDTNVILDHLLDRTPYADYAEKVLKLSEDEEITGLMNASAATDIYYILRKMLGRDRSRELLKTLFSILDVVEVGKNDLLRAMESGMPDYEDALVASCAKRAKAEYIITRNTKDFELSAVPSITPDAFLNQFYAD